VDEKTTKILFALGLTVSFPVVLMVMFSFLNAPSPSRPRARVAPPPVERSLTGAPSSDSTRTRSEAQIAAADSSAPVAQLPPPATAPEQLPSLKPDPATAHQLASMKKELKQELDALKKDRDAMLEALAQGLAALPVNEAATELRTLDDDSAALVLRHLSSSRRTQILSRLETARAQRLQRKLRALATR
jgi:hypothetical protein